MLNKYPLWKYLLILLVIGIGSWFALPNIFGNDPGIQVRGKRGFDVNTETLAQIEQTLASAAIELQSISQDQSSIKIRFNDSESQLKARDLLEHQLGSSYTSALTLLSGAPAWLTGSGALPMFLGLDLRGGVHFLLEVDMDSAIKRAEQRYEADIKTALREAKLRYRGVNLLPDGEIEIRLRDAVNSEQALNHLADQMPELTLTKGAQAELLSARLSEQQMREIRDFALQQNMTALRNRIDQLGVAEPIVQQQGKDRIVIQLPGVQDTARAKVILGRAATLEMRLVDEERDLEAQQSGQAPPGSRLFADVQR